MLNTTTTSKTTREIVEYINNELETRKRHYVEAPTGMVENFQNELKNVEEYNGRQLFEMIQNADDASIQVSSPKKAEVLVKLTKDKLIIANNGEQFSVGGIKSLIYSDVSPKKFQANMVGNKGLGFRSILNWAKEIVIHSHDLHVGFSREYANQFLDDLIEENSQLKTRLQKDSKSDYPIAVLRCPNLENVPANPLPEYDTVIEIVLKPDAIVPIKEQFEKLKDPEILIFLNNLKKVIVDDKGEINEVWKENETDSTSELCSTKFTTGVLYHIVKDEGKVEANDGSIKDYELRVAFNDELKIETKKLYSFFQTEISFPYPVLAHATFELSADRKRLSTDTLGINNQLQSKLAALMIKTALKAAEMRGKVDFFPLEMLSAVNDDLSGIEHFQNSLKEQIIKAKVFPTIANQFKSVEDGIVAFQFKDYSSFFTREQFPLLLKFTDEKSVIRTLLKSGLRKPNFVKLEELFSSNSILLDAPTQAKLIHYLVSDYPNEDLSKLKIFYREDRTLIKPGSKVFLPSTRTFSLPDGMDLEIVNEDLNSELRKIFDVVLQDVLEERLKKFEIKAYRLSRLLEHILIYFSIHKVNDKGMNLLQFLYEIYSVNKSVTNQEEDLSLPDKIEIPILSRNGEVSLPRQLYLGIEYDLELCDLLYKDLDSKFVAPPINLGLSTFSIENLKEFFKWLGVQDKPRVSYVNLSQNDSAEFSEYLFQRIDFNNTKILDRSFDDIAHFKRHLVGIDNFKVTDVDSLDEILLRADNEAVLFWLSQDEVLNGLLSTQKEREEAHVYIKLNGKYRTLVKLTTYPNYLSYKLRRTKWIRTKSGKISTPDSCSLSKTVDESFSPYIEVPGIDHKHVLFTKNGIQPKLINQVLSNIGVIESFGDLSTRNLYGILLRLASQKGEGGISKKAKSIYLEIAENGNEDSQPNSSIPEYQEYLKDGRVLAKKANEFDFMPIKEVYYVNDNVYSDDILKNFWCIDIPKRRNSSKIESILGVRALKDIEFSVTNPIEHGLNGELLVEISNLIPFIYGFRYKTDEKATQLSRLKNSSLVFCTSIDARCNDRTRSFDLNLSKYEFIEDSSTHTWYIIVPSTIKSIEELKSTYKFRDSIAEIYSSILKVSSIRSNIRELIPLNNSERLDYFKAETDDVDGELINLSKKALNRIENYKDAFWKAIFAVKEVEFIFDDFKRDNTTYIKSSLRLDTILLDSFEGSFDYKIALSHSNKKALILFFQEFEINLNDFNKNFDIALIDLTDYHTREFENLRHNFEGVFRQKIFSDLKSKDVVSQEKLLSTWSEYDSIHFAFENVLEYDYSKIFKNELLSKFSIEINFAEVKFEFQPLYGPLEKEIVSKLEGGNEFDLDTWSKFTEALSIKSLICFGNQDYLIETYLNLKAANKIEPDDVTIEKIKVEVTILTDEDNDRLTINDANVSASSESSTKHQGKGGNGRARNSLNPRTHEETGARGEFLVYSALKKNSNNLVQWVSEIGRKYNKGESPIGSDKYHYDIRWKSEGKGHWRYIEVKASTGAISRITMTIDEVKFGESHPENYDLYFVEYAFENYKISAEEEFFNYSEGESFNENSKFTVGIKQYNLGLNLK